MNDQIEVDILSYIVDDDPDTLSTIEEILRANNLTNYKIYNKAEDFLANLNSDIIVCAIDVLLPRGITGLDILKTIKQKNRGSFVIIISGQDNKDVLIDLLNANADKYIDKNKPDYLNKLVLYMQEGLTETKKRWDLINYISLSRKTLKNDK